ncbi:phage tail protein [Kordiimonas lacus]|uniref:Microcystin-dependent protein n=1 Tax=Kordiimonas lacus TaxID=637679 RepID=A0A1G6Y0G2_9PROT|nr:tail fiber protein [Kordiimonas lacus]SDD83207.1 Microcystin-dependent protein [Kordiimonas lacus]
MNKPRNKSLTRGAGAALLGLSALAVSNVAEAECNDNDYTGQICLMATSYCPEGTLEADGTMLQIVNYPALYSLLGTSFGGNGSTYFALPDLRGRVPVGIGQGPGLNNVTLGQTRGQESVIQVIPQMPAHTHTATFTANASDPVHVEVAAQEAITGKVTEKNMLAEPNTGAAPADSVNLFSGTSPATVPLAGVSGGTNTGGTVAVASTGDGQPISVVNPQLGLRYCIVTNGQYPARPE